MNAQTSAPGTGAQPIRSALSACNVVLLLSYLLPLQREQIPGLLAEYNTIFSALTAIGFFGNPQTFALCVVAAAAAFGVLAGFFWDRINPVLRFACFLPALFALYVIIRFLTAMADFPEGTPSVFALLGVGAYLFVVTALAGGLLAGILIFASGRKPGGLGIGSALEALEIDPRLLGMLMAFAAVAVVFTIWTGGTFVGPRNVFNIAVQTVPVAIMACGMVFVIVARHIDLSVGSMLAMCSAIMAMSQTYWLPSIFGTEYGNPAILAVTVVIGLTSGTVIGAVTGWLVGYQRIPSFIVTLGGLFVWRNVNWFTTNGQSVSLTDPNLLMFGGTEGVLGATASWVLGAVASALAVWGIFASRRNKQHHGFIVKPLWAEGAMSGLIVGSILFFVGWLSRYPIPEAKLKRLFEAKGEIMPEGYTAMHGVPISALILILVAVVMTVIARKTTFGRYIFAAGGNPDAAELSGINTRALTVKIFAMMGFLCALAALIAQARLQSHGNDIGMLEELRVIAAAVIGGTALAGGVGTIYGAVLGALIMQSLQSGMAMVGVDTPFQNIIVGLVLIIAVWVDILYRKRLGLSK